MLNDDIFIFINKNLELFVNKNIKLLKKEIINKFPFLFLPEDNILQQVCELIKYAQERYEREKIIENRLEKVDKENEIIEKEIKILEIEIKNVSLIYGLFFYKKIKIKKLLLKKLKQQYIELREEYYQLREEIMSATDINYQNIENIYDIFENIFYTKTNTQKNNIEIQKLSRIIFESF